MDFAEIEDSFERIVRRDNNDQPADPEAEYFTGVLDDDVRKALESLPYDYRMVVILADLEDFSYKEIADILGLPGRNRHVPHCTGPQAPGEDAVEVRPPPRLHPGGRADEDADPAQEPGGLAGKRAQVPGFQFQDEGAEFRVRRRGSGLRHDELYPGEVSPLRASGSRGFFLRGGVAFPPSCRMRLLRRESPRDAVRPAEAVLRRILAAARALAHVALARGPAAPRPRFPAFAVAATLLVIILPCRRRPRRAFLGRSPPRQPRRPRSWPPLPLRWCRPTPIPGESC